MAIVFVCERCGQELSGPDRLAGKRVRCPKCKLVVQVPAAAAPPSAPAPPSAAGPPAPTVRPTGAAAPPPPGAASEEFMTCPGCGNEIRRDAATCFFCGRAIRPPAPPPPAAPSKPAPAAPAAPREKRPLWQRLRRKRADAGAPAAPPVIEPLVTGGPAVPTPASATPDQAAAPATLPPSAPAVPSTPDPFVPLRGTLHTANLVATVWLGVIVVAGAVGAVGGFLAGKMMGLAIGLGAAVVAGTFVTLQWFLIRSFTGLVGVLLEIERNARTAPEAEPSAGLDDTLARLQAVENEAKRLTSVEARLADISRHTANLKRLDEIGDHLRFVLERLREGPLSAPADRDDPTRPAEAGQAPHPEARPPA